MKVKGLDGREHNWKLVGHQPDLSRKCSAPHRRARQLLEKLFPLELRLEEIFLPGGEGKLYLDFFLPSRKLAVEVQGLQHGEFNSFFHQHRPGFVASLGRDGRKKRWCELNKLWLAELPEDESDDDWSARLRGV